MVCARLMHKKNTSKDCDKRDNNNNNNNNDNDNDNDNETIMIIIIITTIIPKRSFAIKIM